MKIKIVNPGKCESCNAKSCKFLTLATVKEDFLRLSSETSICPTSAIDENGPSESDLKKKSIGGVGCVECGLCVRFCPHGNLVAAGCSSKANKFEGLDAIQLKAVTSLYLSLLFDFAANTNRNQALPFDGYVSTSSGAEAFVEIDAGDDSLECLRRILGDVVTYSQSRMITNGIVVLSSFPKSGSRDVYSVVEKMRAFPTTRNIKVYITTFSILRMLCMAGVKRADDFHAFLFDCTSESEKVYLERVIKVIEGQE
jgi:ferredoxin